MNWTEYWGRRYRYWVHTRECRDFIGSLNYSSYTWFYIIESALLVVVQTSHTIPEGMVVFSKMYHTEKYIYKETDWWLSQSCGLWDEDWLIQMKWNFKHRHYNLCNGIIPPHSQPGILNSKKHLFFNHCTKLAHRAARFFLNTKVKDFRHFRNL